MWLVILALRRPYTFVVMAMLIVLLAVVSIKNMGTDILPEIDIPVISVAWNYQGISAEEMEKRITLPFERVLTTTVNDIEHIESLSLYGIGIIKIYFQPGASIPAATAQITAISQTMLRQMPPGSTPPFIMRYSATNVPILWESSGSEVMSESELFDQGVNNLRIQLVLVKGAQVPWPYGGRQAYVMVDLDQAKLYAYGLSAEDVSAALSSQSLILPSGTAKFGNDEYSIRINSSPTQVATFNAIPIKSVGGVMVYMRDVAHVHAGAIPQTSMSHVDGKRGLLQPILKSTGTSTLEIVADITEKMKTIRNLLPKEMHVTPMFDQSVFVRAAVNDVIKEGALAGALTGLMILLFLGSWRSTLIVVVSIPLSILASIIFLSWLGQTLNLMTLGGMALAVGILVDDATVTIENIHRNLSEPGEHGGKKGLYQAIVDGAAQIAVPAFVSTLCICIVFVPVIFIAGAAKSLFVPLAMAVVFAMLTSYFLSRTLVPTLILFLLKGESEHHDDQSTRTGIFSRCHAGFERGFLSFQGRYSKILHWTLEHKAATALTMLLFVGLSFCLFPMVGRDFFPTVDAGQFRFHVRCPPGTRIEESEHYFAHVEDIVKDIIPAKDFGHVSDLIGIPNSTINLSLSDGSLISPADGEILVSLNPGHAPTEQYITSIREKVSKEMPDVTIFFLAADITSQVLNFGLAAPIDIQIIGPWANQDKNLEIAQRITEKLRAVPGAVDIHLAQVTAAPMFKIDVDRTQAEQAGLTQQDVASSLLISLSSSAQTAPNFWLDDTKGIQYGIAIQSPQYRISSLQRLGNIPVTHGQGGQVVSNLSSFVRTTAPVNLIHYNSSRALDVQANVSGIDLGSVSDAINRIVANITPDLPRGSSIKVRGQIQSMNESFTGLGLGLIFAIMLVYLLMVVNFQSWSDPLIIIGAIPGALGGIFWMLFISQTTLSVPALMGAIMSIGVATANSILIVSFANDQRDLGLNARDAAFQAGVVRLRPVLMTAAAMIIGMIPMSLGMGDGGEQNAPLGRAVIGGLVLATFSTLLFVPTVYCALNRRKPPVDLSHASHVQGHAQ